MSIQNKRKVKIFELNRFDLICIVIGIIFLVEITSAETLPKNTENEVKLRSTLLEITFDSKDGLPLWYDLPKLKEQFNGKEDGQTIRIVLKKVIKSANRSIQSILNKTGNGEIFLPNKTDTVIIPLLKQIYIQKKQADVRYEAFLENLKIVSFSIRYIVENLTVFITIADVIEENGYELVEIQTKSLVSIAQKVGNEWLAHGDGGGYYIELAAAKPCVLKDGWSKDFPYFPNFTYLPLVVMGDGKVTCAMEVQGYLCNTQLEVSDKNEQKRATMGVKSYYRVKGESITSLLVEQNEICRLDFIGDYDRNNNSDWLDAAKVMRDRMPLIPTHYYDNRMVWIISGQQGRAEKPAITFQAIEKVIRKINMLTNGIKQAVYISGWTEGGHDTGYPNITKLNVKMGGLPGLQQLKKATVRYDANISFDDNYDDQFNNEYTKGHFDEKYIARNPDGNLMQQRAWNGVDMSHITGMAKYMKDGGPGVERVRQTCLNYDLKKTELVDAITWWSIRNDWDTISPASAVKNLRDGKFKLISEYKKYGIYIISELLRYPFVGKLALVVDGPDGNGWNDFGGTQIPLQRLVYSRSIIYGPGGGDGVARDPRLTLMQNSRRGPWISGNTASDDITNYFYLNFLPWTKLHGLDILSFQRINQSISMELSEKSNIKIDYANKESFTAFYRGVRIMDGNSLTCPIDNKRIAFYSKTERKLTYPVPLGKDTSRFKAKALYEENSRDFPFKIVNGNIEITVPAYRPVIFSF